MEYTLAMLDYLSSSSSSDSEESEEEAIEILEYINSISKCKKERIFKTRHNHFEEWDEPEFHDMFRLSKSVVFTILTQIQQQIEWPTTRNNALTPSQMLLLTLKFLATNSFLVLSASFSGVHKSTASHHIWRVLQAIVKLRTKYINMPSERNIAQIKRDFYDLGKFRNVIGALGCTHVKIASPRGADAEAFRCQKQFFSINVQAICTADLLIQDIVARWPGSVPESRIFENSRVRTRLENGEFGNSVLVANNQYPLTKYCLTPLATTRNQAEECYNEAVIHTRRPIEEAFSVLKKRFPILSLGIRLSLTRVQHIIVTCAVLHNVALLMNDKKLPKLEPDVENAVLETCDVPVDLCTFKSSKISSVIEPYLQYFGKIISD